MSERHPTGGVPQAILVQKFGGTSLADLKGFEASALVIGQYAAERRVVVVLSAVKGVTDLLLAAIDSAVAGEDGAVHLGEAFARQRAIVDELALQGVPTPESSAFFEEQEEILNRRIEGIRLLGQCPDEARARILASGEGFSSRLMVDVLNHRGVRAQWSDTDVLPLANEDWLDSLVDIEAAAPLLRFPAAELADTRWLPGLELDDRVLLFGFIPLGRHRAFDLVVIFLRPFQLILEELFPQAQVIQAGSTTGNSRPASRERFEVGNHFAALGGEAHTAIDAAHHVDMGVRGGQPLEE